MTAAAEGPRLASEVFARRRRQLLQLLPPRSAALFVSPPASVRSNDVEYPYRQDSNLLYLTGFEEPDAAVLLVPDHADGAFHLFVRPRDPLSETWTGRRAGVEGAVTRFGADKAHPIGELGDRVRELVADRETLFFELGRNAEVNEQVMQWLRQWSGGRPRLGRGPVSLQDPTPLVHEMRLFKDDDEMALMRHAAAIGAAGHLAAMRNTRPGGFEYEIEAEVDFQFRRRGAAGPAYPSIVAAGANATILHYIQNDARMVDGDLLLIDAGAEYQGYCSDITRTFPIGRRFTPPQRALYEVVLAAQKAAIAAVRPGVPFDEPHQRALHVLAEGLLSLGLVAGTVEEVLSKELYRPYYMHRTSHWLGMDVHDVGSYRRADEPRKLEAGMVLTIEPGLYVADDAAVDEAYRGIGIRIEDDVLVTPSGAEVLTSSVPKECDELEAIRAEVLA